MTTIAAPRPVLDQLARALNPGDRDLILVPRGTVVEARERITALEFEVSRLKGTLAMTHPKRPTLMFEAGETVKVVATGEHGVVTHIFEDVTPVQYEVEFEGNEVDDFAASELEGVALADVA